MRIRELLEVYQGDERIVSAADYLDSGERRLILSGLKGSLKAFAVVALASKSSGNHLVLMPDKESAAYFYNDIENILEESEKPQNKKKVLFFPASYRRPYETHTTDSLALLQRTEVLNRFGGQRRSSIIVSYPEALCERVASKKFIKDNACPLKRGEHHKLDDLIEKLNEYEFERVDYVAEPGQFSLRGGIVDVYSYSNDYPFRIEFFGDEIDSLRTFNPSNQLSVDKLERLVLMPNVQATGHHEEKKSLFSLMSGEDKIWLEDILFVRDRIDKEYEKAETAFQATEIKKEPPAMAFLSGKSIVKDILAMTILSFNKLEVQQDVIRINFSSRPQPSFNKNFELLRDDFYKLKLQAYSRYIVSDNKKQLERLYNIFEDIQHDIPEPERTGFDALNFSLHEGFVDDNQRLACYTDHQVFERYHKFFLRERFPSKENITLKELHDLKPGDFITHIDHGVGRFEGLEKINNDGKYQEAIRIRYSGDDLLYVSIHSLHRISKYLGKDGTAPRLNKLGSNAWNKLKDKTKKRVKDIAKDLIHLYARRKASKGFAFSPDSYLQHELEASFIYVDTPDQLNTTQDVKKDMEAQHPMDRLVCGDVGFGKTEIAIRAAFKAVADSKQVAVLVPTTILALQHYHTFQSRLKDFPCRVDYINRFKTSKAQKKTLQELENGSLDIIIGTHRIVGKDIKFKDLGLLIIDEEQKFGVSIKEKLKEMRVNVDTLTLTATPIPRTLQFSLMGARDLSIINTPPPNRYPVQTEIRPFGEDVIHNAISYEVSRGGQVYFVHNRVQNIMKVADMLQRFVPGIKIAIGHGQMEGSKLETIMLDFIEGRYDVLLATTIIESGLDIPNVNTIIINDAQNYGLSDLHQLRGRVGRSNKKAFCYLLAPPLSSLTDDARKRLKAIEDYSEIGSGFNIAMRDLDIRGAGNMLGAEQSGFISEIGFDMFQKILDEAIQELKNSDFKGLFKDEEKQELISDCQIETDLEVMIPDSYVTNISERLSLYKEIDNLTSEEAIHAFSTMLKDRFGNIPAPVNELFNALRLRWIAKRIGLEKIILKNGSMLAYFISDPGSTYYSSPQFNYVLKYLKENPSIARLKEKKDKLLISFKNVENLDMALENLKHFQLYDKRLADS